MALDLAIEIAAWCGAAAVVAAHHQRGSERASRLAKHRWQIAYMLGPIALLAMAASKHAWPAAALNLFWAAVAARALLKGPEAMGEESGAASAPEGQEASLARAAASELAAMGVGKPPSAIESVIESGPSGRSEGAESEQSREPSAQREARAMARMGAERSE